MANVDLTVDGMVAMMAVYEELYMYNSSICICVMGWDGLQQHS